MNSRTEFKTEERAALAALSFLLVFTVLWWAFALWPAKADASAMLLRAREVCFGLSASGVPDARGWMVLIGQPVGMLIAIVVIWKESVRGAMSGLVRRGWGRVAVLSAMAVVTIGVGLASNRVRNAIAESTFDPQGLMTGVEEVLDEPVPAFALVDQNGMIRGDSDLSGRPTLITFAFGHCETLCPIMVDVSNRVAERLREEHDPRVVIITVDPWRDTPGRLPGLAEQWMLTERDWALSGDVADVERVLEAFGIVTSRDPSTGEITHPGRIFLVDAKGGMRYSVPADIGRIEGLVRGL